MKSSWLNLGVCFNVNFCLFMPLVHFDCMSSMGVTQFPRFLMPWVSTEKNAVHDVGGNFVFPAS